MDNGRRPIADSRKPTADSRRKKMIKGTLIADAGSTKTEWFFGGKTIITQGINPIQQDEDAIIGILYDLRHQLSPIIQAAGSQANTANSQTSVSLSAIRFYGAGCTPEKCFVVKRLLKEVFEVDDIQVHSDLLAAAHALCGNERGVACILGTGSNSCLYDGEKIIQNTPALGYILGDEGSGAVLGRLFLNALLKGRLPQNVVDAFKEEYNLSQADIIERVYRQPMANRFLASLSVFIGKYKTEDAVHQIIATNFSNFLDNNVRPYNCTNISFTGSIAFHYANILREVAEQKGYCVKKITKAPMEDLIHLFY